ncbi:MAG TPA: hypothetical protein VGR47_01535 [Terracidiphilus sp.]|nr:hypothetical protein [Terracidiphilus sp.]
MAKLDMDEEDARLNPAPLTPPRTPIRNPCTSPAPLSLVPIPYSLSPKFPELGNHLIHKETHHENVPGK